MCYTEPTYNSLSYVEYYLDTEDTDDTVTRILDHYSDAAVENDLFIILCQTPTLNQILHKVFNLTPKYNTITAF